MSYEEGEDVQFYPNSEDFYEDYLASIERGEADPPELEVQARIRGGPSVSSYDDRRSTVPFFSLRTAGTEETRAYQAGLSHLPVVPRSRRPTW